MKKPRCTRAEASDVANAILDGSDCVMLSGETAKGDYPVQCIKTMSSLTQEAEACLWNERFFEEQLKQVMSTRPEGMDATQTTAVAAVQASYSCRAAAIIAITTSGLTAQLCSKISTSLSDYRSDPIRPSGSSDATPSWNHPCPLQRTSHGKLDARCRGTYPTRCGFGEKEWLH